MHALALVYHTCRAFQRLQLPAGQQVEEKQGGCQPAVSDMVQLTSWCRRNRRLMPVVDCRHVAQVMPFIRNEVRSV